MSAQTLTFSSLSSLHEHLRGGQIVRLLEVGWHGFSLVFIPAGQPHSSCRLIRVSINLVLDPVLDEKGIFSHNQASSVFTDATSEPTEFSEWF